MSRLREWFTWSKHASVKADLRAGFVGVIALTITVGAVSWLNQGRSVSAVNKLLAVDGRIAELSMRSNAAMFQAQSAEKDFLLFQNEIGFNEARSRYLPLVQTNVAGIRQNMAEIRDLADGPEWILQTRAIEQIVTVYETGFLKTVDLYGRLGSVTPGFEGQFRNKSREIESIIRPRKLDRLMVDFLTLRRNEKDFIARGQDKYAEAFMKGIGQFKRDLAATALSRALKVKLSGMADEYQSLFKRYVQTEQEIDAESTVYRAAASGVEAMLETLYFNANQRAIATRTDVQKATRATTWTILGASLIAALLGLSVAWIMSRAITRSVGETLAFANRVAAGDLTTRLTPRGKDEFGILADALNQMTEELQESHTSLEARATELAESNRALQDEFAVRKHAEEELRRIERARKVMAFCNHALMHATSEADLLKEMCRIAVEDGGYRMAWIGYAEHDEAKSVTPVAQAGFDEGYVGSRRVTWADEERGSGASGVTIRTGKPKVIRNIHDDPQFPPWREEALKRGYASVLGLPLRNETGRVFGSISIYSAEPNAFDEAEVGLLMELADDIAFGIMSLRTAAARKLAEEALRLRHRAVESSVNAVVVANYTKPDYPIEYVNPAFERITGYTAAEAAGRNSRFLQADDRDQPGIEDIRAALREQREGHAVLRNYRKDGSLFWNDLHIAPVRDDAGLVTHFVGVLNDITETRNYEKQLERQANFDTLTGLANRNLLQDRLEQAVANAHRHNQMVAVLFLDLDHFKIINDSLGHGAGDELLKTVAERLKSCVRESDTVARVGGDEFVLILPDQSKVEDIPKVVFRIVDSVSSSPQIVETLQRILGAVAQTVVVANREFVITCSIGLSLYPQDGQDAETLLTNADAAMYRAKELGRNNFQFYTAELNARIGERLTLQGMLRRALEREEFVLYYQPKINLESRQMSGAEALLRWNSPERGLVQPFKFIPILEETGMIIDVGRWVMMKAISDYEQWLAEGRQPPRIAVNVSQVQLKQKDFAAVVEEAIKNNKHGAACLDLEITESMIMKEIAANIDKLKAIREMGVGIEIDDFGTGYSSLSQLAKLPVDALKIDRAFIMNITTSADDLAIVSMIISLAHSLKLKVIAEGVETEEQLKILRLLKCEEMQGYLISPAIPAKEFWEWQERYSLAREKSVVH